MTFASHAIRVGSGGVPGPGAPVLTLGVVTSTSVALSWTASSFYYGIAAYQVWRSQGSAGNAQVVAIVGGGALTYTDNTVSPSTTYSYYVTATGNGLGNPQSNPSNTVVATTQGTGGQDFFPAGVGPDGYVFNGKTVTDPYAAYQTWYVDQTVGIDPAPGSHKPALGSGTGYVNGSYVYATYQAAVTDALYAGATIGTGRRVIIRQSAAWNGGSSTPYVYALSGGPANTYKPLANAGGSVALPYVIQGDPAVSGLAVYDGGGATTPQSTAQTATVGFWLFGNGGNQNWIIRKIKFQNATNDFVSVQNSTGNGNITVEYCAAAVINYDGLSGNLGAWYCTGPSGGGQSVGSVTFRYCCFYNFSTMVASGNNAAIGTYGQDNLTVKNCYFAYMHSAIKTKLSANTTPSASANNWVIKNTLFSNLYQAIDESEQNQGGASQNTGPISGWQVTNNLFFGSGFPVGPQSASVATGGGCLNPQGTNMLFASNTVAETVSGGFQWCGVTTDVSGNGLQLRDNVMLNAGVANNYHFWQFGRADWFSTTASIKASYIDYNVYGPPANGVPFAINLGGIAFANFGAWQSAYTTNPANAPDLATLIQPSHNPDPNGASIPNYGAPFNTVAGNYPNRATFNYAPGPGSPLLAASSTGGTVGAIMNTVNDDGSFGIGPGWFY